MSQNNTWRAKVVQNTAHGFLPAHINGTVMLSASETSQGVARFAESKNDLTWKSLASRTPSAASQLRFAQNDNLLFVFAQPSICEFIVVLCYPVRDNSRIRVLNRSAYE
jgi:hypothetical protein